MRGYLLLLLLGRNLLGAFYKMEKRFMLLGTNHQFLLGLESKTYKQSKKGSETDIKRKTLVFWNKSCSRASLKDCVFLVLHFCPHLKNLPKISQWLTFCPENHCIFFSLHWVHSRGLYILLNHRRFASLQNIVLASIMEGNGFTTLRPYPCQKITTNMEDCWHHSSKSAWPQLRSF